MEYQEGKIYKIVGSGLTYYGSTKQTLKARLRSHKCSSKCSSKQIIDLNNYDIILVELFPCNLRKELFARERWFIENNECVNKNIPNRTYKEYNDTKKEQQKQYDIDNKEKRKEQQRQRYLQNKDKIKQYNIDNADKLKEQRRQKYLQKKEQNNNL